MNVVESDDQERLDRVVENVVMHGTASRIRDANSAVLTFPVRSRTIFGGAP